MNYLLTVKNEKILKRPDIKLYTGNIGTYTFSFDFDEHWSGLLKFVSFTNNSETYVVEAKNDYITIPSEILEKSGLWSFGVFATNGEDNIKRISSNLLEFEVIKGAYSEGLTPQTPTPDVWESLFRNSIPEIRNGYWYIFSIDDNDYVNTGIRAVGTMPVKGVDYFTEEDISSLGLDGKENISKKIPIYSHDMMNSVDTKELQSRYPSYYVIKQMRDEIYEQKADRAYVDHVIQVAILNSWEENV